MKFNKSFLFATLIAGTFVLSGCNDKDQKPAQSSVNETEVQPEQKNQAPQAQPATENTQALAQFNQSVKFAPVSRNVVKAEDGTDMVSIVYSLENLSDKPISAIHLATLYSHNNQPLYSSEIPLSFEEPLAPKATITVTENTVFDAIPEQTRAIAIDPNNNIQITFAAFKLVFADGSEIVVAQPK